MKSDKNEALIYISIIKYSSTQHAYLVVTNSRKIHNLRVNDLARKTLLQAVHLRVLTTLCHSVATDYNCLKKKSFHHWGYTRRYWRRNIPFPAKWCDCRGVCRLDEHRQ